MFHMLSCFKLKPGEDIDIFRRNYDAFVADMKGIDLYVINTDSQVNGR